MVLKCALIKTAAVTDGSRMMLKCSAKKLLLTVVAV
jgi:hypothetical protein